MSGRADNPARWTALALWGLALTLASPAPAPAQNPHPIPESERWATITHPGNAPYIIPQATGPLPVGRVDYEYQISRTEVTGAEWFEFVQAYLLFAPPPGLGSVLFRSNLVAPTPTGPALIPGAENKPVEVGWRFAARYANWLHNGKALTQDAFESGAYDTSTFGSIPGEGFTDQISRSPGARYWIPSLDELIKSWHYDPNRYGPDQPGYWLYSTSSDDPPVRAPPGAGQTNTGTNFLYDVASYRDVQSPWGLWDASGGVTEWTESVYFQDPETEEYPSYRWIDGTSWRGGLLWSTPGDSTQADRVDRIAFRISPDASSIGFRLAREIPAPSSAVVLAGAFHVLIRRRRLAHDTLHPDRGLCARPWRRPSVCREPG